MTQAGAAERALEAPDLLLDADQVMDVERGAVLACDRLGVTAGDRQAAGPDLEPGPVPPRQLGGRPVPCGRQGYPHGRRRVVRPTPSRGPLPLFLDAGFPPTHQQDGRHGREDAAHQRDAQSDRHGRGELGRPLRARQERVRSDRLGHTREPDRGADQEGDARDHHQRATMRRIAGSDISMYAHPNSIAPIPAASAIAPVPSQVPSR